MKIYEIIIESRVLTEGLFVSALEKLGAAQAFGGLAKLLAKSPKAKAIEELTTALTDVGERSGIGAIDAAVVELRKVGTNEEVIAAAVKSAKTATNKALISKGLESFAKLSGSGWQKINAGLMAWGLGKPIYDCADGIADAYARNAAGDPEYQGSKLQGAIQLYLNRAVAQIITLLAGRGMVKLVASIPKNFFSYFYNGPMLDTIFGGLTKLGQTAFTSWMVSPYGQKAFAEWIVGSSFSGSSMHDLSNYVGGWTKSAYDLIAAKATGQENLPGTTTPDAAVKQDTDNTGPAEKPTPGSQLVFDPATGARLK